MNYPQIIFIRHGQTNWNVEERYQGQVDVPINDVGREQAVRNGNALCKFLAGCGRKPQDYQWVCSPQIRARQTLDLIIGTMSSSDIQYELENELMEISFGVLEGHTADELVNLDPKGVKERKSDKWGYTPRGGESYKSAMGRVRSWLDKQNKPVIAVSHGGICRLLRGFLFEIPEMLIPELEVPQDRFLVCERGCGEWL